MPYSTYDEYCKQGGALSEQDYVKQAGKAAREIDLQGKLTPDERKTWDKMRDILELETENPVDTDENLNAFLQELNGGG